MKEIPLTRGMVAIVDDEDHSALTRYRWFTVSANSRAFYAGRRQRRPSGGWDLILMHRDILRPLNDLEIDHVNRDGLDNRRCNLRACTHAQNMANRGPFKNNKCGHKGVYFAAWRNKWRAKICVDGRYFHLGYFPNADAASQAYDTAAAQHCGEFAFANAR